MEATRPKSGTGKDETPIIRSSSTSSTSSSAPVLRSASSSSSSAAAAAPFAAASGFRSSASDASVLASEVGSMKLSEVPMAMVRSSASDMFFVERTTRSVGPVATAPAPALRGPHAAPGPLMGMAPSGTPFIRAVSSGVSPIAGSSLQSGLSATTAVGAKSHSTAAAPLRTAGPQRVLFTPVVSSGPTLLSSSKSKSGARLERPSCVPAPPFFLTAYTVHLTPKVGLSALRSTVESALRDCAVDYEYNDAKWKAKCYMYRACGNCSFVLRLYTNAPAQPSSASAAGPFPLIGASPVKASASASGLPVSTSTAFPFPATPSPTSSSGSPTLPVPLGTGDSFLIELQRRKGCGHLFRRTFDRLIAHFAKTGLLPTDCPAAARAKSLGLLTLAPEAPLSTAETSTGTGSGDVKGVASDPCASTSSPPFSVLQERTDVLDSDDEEETSSDDSASASGANGPTVRDPKGVVDAFTSLAGLLASEYDDIAAPAAQAIAGLCASRKLRTMVGEMGSNGLKALLYQQQTQALAAAAGGSGTPSSPAASGALLSPPSLSPQQQADGQAILSLFSTLLNRSMNGHVSIECRTASAIALCSLAKDPLCAAVIASFGAPARLLMTTLQTSLSAPTAALRRELVRCVVHVYTHAPQCIKAGLQEPSSCHLRNRALMQPAFVGLDAAFDGLVARLDSMLMPVAQEAGMVPTGTGTGMAASPAASSAVAHQRVSPVAAAGTAGAPTQAAVTTGAAPAGTSTSVPPPQPGTGNKF